MKNSEAKEEMNEGERGSRIVAICFFCVCVFGERERAWDNVFLWLFLECFSGKSFYYV